MSHSNLRTRRPRANRALAALLVAGMVHSAVASPGDVTTIPAPMVGTDPPKAETRRDGDSSVSTQTGTLQYSYPITVPPGRLGNQPSLALSYSSQGALYGGIAAGWSLSVPEIRLDESKGTLSSHYMDGFNSDPWADDKFISTMAGSRPLVAVTESTSAGVYKTYRAQNDSSFARYERMQPGQPFLWRVYATDGTIYYFGDATFVAGAVNQSQVPLTRSVDAYGNTVEYRWDSLSHDNRLLDIRYTSNPSLGLAAFAKVEFSYDQPVSCPGSIVPIGAALDYRTGNWRITGAQKLTKIVSTAYDPANGTTLHTRQVSLSYAADAESCASRHAPIRLLSSIQESAWGAATPRVDLPPVSFDYGDLAYYASVGGVASPGWITNPVGGRPYLSWGHRYQDGRPPTVEAMMLDFDGDGLEDRLSNDSSGLDCGLRWEKNTGAGFSAQGHVGLPRLPWSDNAAGPDSAQETCSLSGQVTMVRNYTDTTPGSQTHNNGTTLAYRWLDMNADGLPDLVTAIAADPDAYRPDLEPNLYAWPACGGLPSDGACPVVTAACAEGAWDCSGDLSDTCPVNQDVQTCAAVAPHIPCYGAIHMNQPNLNGGFYCSSESPDINQCKPVQGGGGDNSQLPYTRCGDYPWMIYWNTGNGQLGQIPDIKYEPIPLESDSGDSSFGGNSVLGPDHAVTDVDGDGVLDAVLRARAIDVNSQSVFTPIWWLWRGDGAGGFSPVPGSNMPYAWLVPSGMPPSAATVYTPNGPGQINPWMVPSSIASMVDLNGDGLADMVWQPALDSSNPPKSIGPAQVFYNDGQTHRTGARNPDGTFQTVPNLAAPITRLSRSSVAVTQFDTPTLFPIAGTRLDRTRLQDVDGDGRQDLIHSECLASDCSTWQPAQVYYNGGGGFLPGVTPSSDDPGSHAGSMSFTVEGDNVWMHSSDFVDLDGDGAAEFVQAAYGNPGVVLTTFPRSDKAHPMRLMKKIDNGRGLVTTVDYATLTDSAVVTSDTTSTSASARRASPHTAFVVKQLTTTDLHESTPSFVKYRYKYPHWSKDDEGRWGFRGFDEVRTIASNGAGTGDGASTLQRYDYSVDWSGRLASTQTLPSEAPTNPVSISETTWTGYALFGGKITTYHPVTSRSWTCSTGQTETQCKAAPAGFTLQQSTWTPLSSTTAAGGSPLLWVETAQTQQDSEAFNDGDRKTTTGYALAADGTTYRLRRTTQSSSWQLAGAMVEYAKSELRYPNSNYRNPDFEDTYASSNTSTKMTTAKTYDAAGNVDTVQKPVQAGTAAKTSYTYDSRKLFVDTTTNELGHVVKTVYDYGTGALLRTIGPNVKTCTGLCGTQLSEESRTDVDGLGRPIASWVSLDAGSGAASYYTLAKVGTVAYVDAVTAAIPAAVLTNSLIEFDDTRWTQDKTELDGRGRPIRKISYVQGTAPVDAITTYDYDANGKVVAVTVPDASANSSASVTFSYGYDSIGRPTSIRRPGASPQAGIDVTYSGLVETRTEVAGAAGGAAGVSKFTKDAFGRLVTVQEQLDDSTWATTTYSYEPHDRISRIIAPDTNSTNVTTSIVYDFLGRRTSIYRGSRIWKYGYDKNGNMQSEVSPYPASNIVPDPTPAQYTSTTVYDDLDRPLSRTIGTRGLSDADLNLFGASQIVYQYDQGTNGLGRLSNVSTNYVSPSGTTRTALTSTYTYDAQGNVTSDGRSISIGGLVGTFSKSQTYAPSGKPRLTTYGDRVTPGGTSTSSRTYYDNRGLPSKVDLNFAAGGTQQLAIQTRNVSGLVTQRATTYAGASYYQNWTYDAIGRMANVNVQKAGTGSLATQTIGYYGLDDPSSIGYSFGAPVSITKGFSFTFDKRHQLKTVSNGMSANYVFNKGGRFSQATISAPTASGSDVRNRDVTYEYGPTDPEAVSVLRNVSGGLPFATYAYDTVGNQTQRVYTSPAQTVNFVYDGDDQLRRAAVANGGTEEYFYDHTGARVGIVKRNSTNAVTEVRYFDGGDVEVWLSPAGAVTQTYAYLSLGTPIARVSNRTAFDLEFHGLTSNLLATVDGATGAVTTAIVNGPYGEIVQSYQNTTSGPGGGPIGNHRRRFNDKYEDEVSGLSYYGVRYFDEVSMNWTQADPQYRFVPDSAWTDPRRANLYQFDLSNPVRFLDPDGRRPLSTGDWSIPDAPRTASTTTVGSSSGPSAGGSGGPETLYKPVNPGPASIEQRCQAAGLVIATSTMGIVSAAEAAVAETEAAATVATVATIADTALSVATGTATAQPAMTLAIAAGATAGIYEFHDGVAYYVGQSQDVPRRIGEHLASGKAEPGTQVTVTPVAGGKLKREIAEHLRIQEITNGVPARQSTLVSNKVDPIGPKRKHLLPKPAPKKQ